MPCVAVWRNTRINQFKGGHWWFWGVSGGRNAEWTVCSPSPQHINHVEALFLAIGCQWLSPNGWLEFPLYFPLRLHHTGQGDNKRARHCVQRRHSITVRKKEMPKLAVCLLQLCLPSVSEVRHLERDVIWRLISSRTHTAVHIWPTGVLAAICQWLYRTLKSTLS